MIATQRSLYFGYVKSLSIPISKNKRLYYGRHIYSYVTDIDGGTWSLCVHGPANGSRISAELRSEVIASVYIIALCEPAAVVRFDASRWVR